MGDVKFEPTYPPEHIWQEMTKRERRIVIDEIVASYKMVPNVLRAIEKAIEQVVD
jgi:hypothetical protein